MSDVRLLMTENLLLEFGAKLYVFAVCLVGLIGGALLLGIPQGVRHGLRAAVGWGALGGLCGVSFVLTAMALVARL